MKEVLFNDLFVERIATINGTVREFVGKECCSKEDSKIYSYDNYCFARYLNDNIYEYYYNGEMIKVIY